MLDVKTVVSSDTVFLACLEKAPVNTGLMMVIEVWNFMEGSRGFLEAHDLLPLLEGVHHLTLLSILACAVLQNSGQSGSLWETMQ